MFCPHTIVFDTRHVFIMRHERADYHTGTPLSERLNPLRYEISVRNRSMSHRFTINDNAIFWRWWSNANWWLWKRAYTDMRRAQLRRTQ